MNPANPNFTVPESEALLNELMSHLTLKASDVNATNQYQPQSVGFQPKPQPESARLTQQPLLEDIAVKYKLIQQQLKLYLHARNCRQLSLCECDLPHCKTMKTVLDHMKDCIEGKTCPVPHCSPTGQIVGHWNYCKQDSCPVCLPFRQTKRKGATVLDDGDSKLRQNMLSILINAIIPNYSNQQVMLEPRAQKLVARAKEFETRLYDTTNSTLKYCHLMAEKICEIQSCIAERQRSRTNQQLLQQ